MIDVNNLEFWETVKGQYLEHNTYDFICLSSWTFEAAWKQEEDIITPEIVITWRPIPYPGILQLAREFIDQSPIWQAEEIVDEDTLFPDIDRDDRFRIRLDFINYCIDKFQTK